MRPGIAFLQEQVVPAVLCFTLAFAVSRMQWFRDLENLTFDGRTRLRAVLHPVVPNDDLALVAIDEASLRDFGRWPWNRDMHGDLLRLVAQVQPAVVSWDLLFVEPSPNDQHFATGVLSVLPTPVVLGAVRADNDEGLKPEDEIVRGSNLKPLPHVEGDRARIPSDPAMLLPTGLLGQVAHPAFVDTPRDPDGKVRQAPLVVKIGGHVYPTLSLQTLMQYWKARPEDVRVELGRAVTIETRLARRRIPVDETGAYLINYRHTLSGFRAYGYSTVVFQLTRRIKKVPGPIPPLRRRILLVGQVAEGLSDFGATPLSGLTPMMLVHANVIENVLTEDYPHVLPGWPVWLGGLALSIAGLAAFSKGRLREQAVFSLGIPVCFVLAATFAWVNGSHLLPLSGPLLAFCAVQVFMIGRRVILEQRAKDQIKGMFGTYVSPALVNRMIESGESPRLGGHEDDITAYFSDIQGFSTFSEKLPPEKLVELMNEYLTACTDIVQEEGGTLDKYIGDAVVAMFGAPIALSDHAYRACVTALRVQRRLGELRAKWMAEGEKWPLVVRAMQSRIGLNSGICTIGNMGSRTRFNYTMMGDNVNLAARMESGAKSWGTYTMCTEATKVACEKHGGDRVVFRPLGRIVVKGRSQPVPIYEAAGLKEQVTAATRECIAIFSDGLERYHARDWAGALAAFRRSAELEPLVPRKTPGVNSNPSLVYIDVIAEFQHAPPPENWDGVYVMKEK